ncbi:DNA gyrase subunit A [Thermomicrobium sp. CFH 73360]|uniref:DNA gyrase subunit A n=1 Tax=Thermomicrobium sp. CFH 73360 TaxID=2951987 RepID=UPI0020772B0B|nr:DNA gyrase subunit A [Thermomicrobium sp. CFH 73360]MCM8747117.1 DNA gyrase subunit A [Thermomicrobium sp. CFH 73360]
MSESQIGRVQIVTIEEEMKRSYLDYAMSVIVQRALPDVRDGLKPVQRRILYGMHEMGLRPNAKYRKSAGIVGEVLKSYHPHGDSAVYDALVRMVQPFTMRYPLIDGQGNFGSIDGDGAAAMRYTEARLAPIAEELLADIEKQTVDFVPNYDDSTREPAVLPARLPNLLLNGASGIAVGMATNIPPHNLGEVVDALVYLIDHPEATVEELVERLPGPDFPTGGIILGREGILAAYATGRGRIVVRARAHIEEHGRGRTSIIVTELPYQVNKAALIEKIAELVKAGRLEGIHDLRDESDRDGMRIVIELKRDAQPRAVLNNLFKQTQLQTTFGVNMLALVDGTLPRVLTLRRMLQLYLEHRQHVVRRRTEFELRQAERRAHVLEGLKIALDHLDEVIATIRNARSADDARQQLMNRFSLTELQANAILDMQLRRLAALERQKIEEEYQELLTRIAELRALLADPTKILAVIRRELLELKEQYGDRRRTQIQDVSVELRDEDLVPKVDILVTLTARGYIKRSTNGHYRVQHRGGRGVNGMTVRDEDYIQHVVLTSTHDSLLFFTNRGRVFQLPAYEIPDAGRTARGLPIVNFLNLQPGEEVTTLLPVRDFGAATFLFFCTRQGRVKRVRLDEFSNVRASGLIAMTLDAGDELVWVRPTSGSNEVILVTALGQAIRFPEDEVRPVGRQAGGVIGIRLDTNDYVVAAEVVSPDADLLIVSRHGYGKRTALQEFRVQGRGGSGVIAMKVTARTGHVAAATVAREDDTAVLVSRRGRLIVIPVRQIPRLGRSTQGVALMRLQDNDEIASIAVGLTSEALSPTRSGKEDSESDGLEDS